MVGRLDNKFNWEIQNQREIAERLDRLGKVISDFRIPLRIIASDFYRSQRQLFTLQSKGLYEDLSDKYKAQKQKKLGFAYPILLGKTRNLANSTLGRDHKNSIFSLGKRELIIGTNVPYGKYHQSDKPRTKLPQRKFIFITGGRGDQSKDSGIYGRRERWISIIDTHIDQLIRGEI